MVTIFKNIGETSTSKTYYPVILLSVICKVIEKRLDNRLFDQLQQCGLFSDFQHGFGSSTSTADLLMVVSVRIARSLNGSGTISALALDISNVFNRV